MIAAAALAGLARVVGGVGARGAALAAAGLAVFGAWLWISELRGANAALRRETAALSDAVADAEAEIAIRAAAIAALERAAAADRARDTAAARLKEEVVHAPADDDGRVAPVLRRALDGLRAP